MGTTVATSGWGWCGDVFYDFFLECLIVDPIGVLRLLVPRD
jgi:hypothetical protein